MQYVFLKYFKLIVFALFLLMSKLFVITYSQYNCNKYMLHQNEETHDFTLTINKHNDTFCRLLQIKMFYLNEKHLILYFK